MKVEQFRNQVDFLFDAINVHRHSCVRDCEREQWLTRTTARLADVRALVCPRAKADDLERWRQAIAQTEQVLSTYRVTEPQAVPAHIKLAKAEYSRMAGESVEVEEIGGALYAFGSELATLRLFRKMPSNSQGYSSNLKRFYFLISEDV